MAETSIISYTIEDADGNQTTFPVYYPQAGVDFADVVDFATDFTPILDGVTDGKITRVRAQIELILGTHKSDAVAGSNIQEGGLIPYDADGTTLGYSEFVPAFKQSLFVGKSIDMGATAVTDFVSGQVAPPASVTPSDKYGNVLVSAGQGVKRFRKFSRQERRA
jgi:hypothetical protein